MPPSAPKAIVNGFKFRIEREIKRQPTAPKFRDWP
jgi:hypothetical protein